MALMKDSMAERTNDGEKSKDFSMRALLLMILFSLLLLAGDSPAEQSANRDAIRDKPWYSQMRQVLAGIFEIGGCEVNGYVDKEYYFNQYEWLKEAYPRSMQELSEQYGITDPSILAGIEDAIYTEFFDAGRIHMCVVDAATTSVIKSEINARLQLSDERASHGLFNIKAYRITRDIYDQFPEELQREVSFDEEKGHANAEELARYLTTGSLSEQFERNLTIYFATAAAREGEINYYVEMNGYTYDQKTFITGRMVCCTDPTDPEKKITPHFAYYLLQNKEAAEKFFTEMGIGKPPAQTE